MLLPVVDGDEIVGVVTADDIGRAVDDAGAAPTVSYRLSPETPSTTEGSIHVFV